MSHAENPAEAFIDEEFPIRFRPFIPPALKRAYTAADQLIERTEWLHTPSGRFQRGDLIVKATEFEFFKLIDRGSLPFEPSWDDYAQPTGKHLVMRTRRARITINRVPEQDQSPRHAKFRDNFGIGNMEYLWPEWNTEERQKGKLRHILLLHGYQPLSFANLAYPHPKRGKLVHQTSNLLNILHDVSSATEGPAEEGPSESPDPETLEVLEKFIRDNDKS